MRWIKFYQSMLTHHKVLELSTKTGFHPNFVITALVKLWFYALDNFTSGDISQADPKVLAGIMGISGRKIQNFLVSMVETGWLDKGRTGRLKIHQWEQYEGLLVQQSEDKRSYNRARAAKIRVDKLQTGGQQTVDPLSPIEQNRIEENRTEQNRTEQNTVPPGDGASPGVVVGEDPLFIEFWTLYPKKFNKQKTREFWPKGEGDAVLEGLQRWQNSQEWGREGGRYIPSPVKFLQDQRWKSPPAPAEDGISPRGFDDLERRRIAALMAED
jgi:hypothetical protein